MNRVSAFLMLALVLGHRDASAQIASPSFDCTAVAAAAEVLICEDVELARLDRVMASAFDVAMRRVPLTEAARYEAVQAEWLIVRNNCVTTDDPVDCLRANYVRRIVALRTDAAELASPEAVIWYCNDDRRLPFTTTFYNDSDPPTVVLTWGDDEAVATLQRSGSRTRLVDPDVGSGARYLGPGVEFKEHLGEAVVRWRGKPLLCKR